MNKNDNCQICSDTPDSPEPSNVIPSPVQFQKQEPADDYDDEDEEDLDIETLDDEKLLVDPEWQLWSDNQIAKQCAVDHKTVAKIRNDLQKSDLGFPKIQERNFERNGKTHTMNTTNIGAKKEDSPEYLEPDDDKALPISEVLGSNVIKAPVEFKKPPVQKEVHVDPDYPDDDDEDEEDLDIETLDDEKLLVDPEWQGGV